MEDLTESLTLTNVATIAGLTSSAFNLYNNRETIYNGVLTVGKTVDYYAGTEFFSERGYVNATQKAIIRKTEELKELTESTNTKNEMKNRLRKIRKRGRRKNKRLR